MSVAGLEDDDGMPTARGTKATKQKRRSYNRRGDIYSDDEDEDTYRRRGRDDEYDREDGFLASSDEEPEVYEDEEGEEVEEDDPDVDDLEIEGRATIIENRTRGVKATTPKRTLDRSEDDDDRGGDVDATSGSPQARKKRRVIDDDDEDDE